jgi:integrase
MTSATRRRRSCWTRGVDLNVIKEFLGHSQIGVTADIYAHVLERLHRNASDALGRAVFGDEDDDQDDDDDDIGSGMPARV